MVEHTRDGDFVVRELVEACQISLVSYPDILVSHERVQIKTFHKLQVLLDRRLAVVLGLDMLQRVEVETVSGRKVWTALSPSTWLAGMLVLP